ncbi:MAG: IclR family transcriptional regulator [Thiothrix sp.]|nr:IclR family transcriptional regulator [Thiothrix sp.]HPQ94869.1 IclR family transcriptional regulator [Thiolinea sp.]
MSSALAKALSVLEYMVQHPLGCPVSDIAQALDLPVSGVHRLLKELEKSGYVNQTRGMGDYQLTIKLASLGLSYLGQTGIPNISQPILDALAQESRELVRLALADGDTLVWVGVAQGASGGLRYDPGSEQGQVVHLASSAGGQAWLAAMSDDEAIALALKQGLLKPQTPGDTAPGSVADLLAILNTVRQRGYSLNANSFLQGMAAMATVVRDPDTRMPIGTVSIAGPAARLTPDLMESHAEALLAAAQALGEASRASGYFSRHHVAATRNIA